MSKKNRRQQVTKQPAKQKNNARYFKFGDAETALNDRDISLGIKESLAGANVYDYLGTFLDDSGEYYLPPTPKAGLARLLKANAYHGAIPRFKTNLVMRAFEASSAVSFEDAFKVVHDFNVFGEGYFYKVPNIFGHTIKLQHLMSINMRVKTTSGYRLLQPNNKFIDFDEDEIIQVCDYSVSQSIYGEPDYVGAIQSILLNEEATIFRRKFYINGAHVGYIFYINDDDLTEEDELAIKEQLKGSKGVGNFQAMFLNIPGGGEKAVQIIPIGDFSSKDDLAAIKNISRDDIIAAWRIPPALASIIPSNTSGFGDIEKIDRVYTKNEILPIRRKVINVNEHLRQDQHISFANDLEVIDK